MVKTFVPDVVIDSDEDKRETKNRTKSMPEVISYTDSALVDNCVRDTLLMGQYYLPNVTLSNANYV